MTWSENRCEVCELDGPQDPGASTDTPVRDQGPGWSLPGPDAGHPLQGAGRLAIGGPTPGRQQQQRPTASISDRRQRITLARSVATWDMSGLKADGRGSAPFRRGCSQDCSQAAEQHTTHVDNSGISAQPTTGDGRSWTTCPLLRIRRLGVRVPPSAPSSQARLPARQRAFLSLSELTRLPVRCDRSPVFSTVIVRGY